VGEVNPHETFAAGICCKCKQPINWNIGYLLAHDGLYCLERCALGNRIGNSEQSELVQKQQEPT